jgi:hypothetical protein
MDFPCQGQFWLPGFADKPVFGTLTFSRREGAQLSLADSLPGSDRRREFETIQGQTASGAYVTLLHVIRTSEPLFMLTPTRPCSYHATFLVIGAAFDGETDMRFSLWQLRIPELKWWVGRHGFAEISSSDIVADREHPSRQIVYRTPERQALLRSECGLEISLAFWPLLSVTPFMRTIRQDVCLEMRLADSDSLADFMTASTRFEHFLTLATGSLVRTGSIRALVRAGETHAAERPVMVDILYEPVRNAPARTPRKDEFLFSLDDIAGLEPNCLGNWFSKAEWLHPVCALYFGTLYNPSRYLDFNFLALVQALEAYHRRASDETDLPAAEHDGRLQAVLEAAPAAHREWLTEKLRYSNEISLRRRLKRLFAQFSFLLDDLIPDRKATINAIYDNRNYLTHYDAKLTGRSDRGSRLAYLVEVLKLLLQACFLRELGFADEKIREFVGRSRTVRMIRHLSQHAAGTAV